MAEVKLNAEIREQTGSSSSRRLRDNGRIPGVVYGHGEKAKPVSVNARELRSALNTDAGTNALIDLKVDGKSQLVVARELKRDPVRGTVDHLDFLIVRRGEKITAEVPIVPVGEADKVTKGGGVVEHIMNQLVVVASPTEMPHAIEVDISELQMDESIRVRDISLPKGVSTDVDPDEVLFVGKITRATLSTEEEASSAEAVSSDAAKTAEETAK